MASSWAARQALTLARLSAPRSAFQSPSLIQRRSLSGAAGKILISVFFVCIYNEITIIM